MPTQLTFSSPAGYPWLTGSTRLLKEHEVRRRENGFTLLEMLVVIVIILVLAALLMPVLVQMKRSAQSVQCIANLKRLNAARMAFQVDYDGWIPRWHGTEKPDYALSAIYPNLLLPYLVSDDARTRRNDEPVFKELLCPAMSGDQLWTGFKPGVSYAVNNIAYSDLPVNAAIYIQHLPHPEETIWLVDGWATFYPGKEKASSKENYPNVTERICFPHNNRANAIFLDGHVETFADTIPSEYLDPWGGLENALRAYQRYR